MVRQAAKQQGRLKKVAVLQGYTAMRVYKVVCFKDMCCVNSLGCSAPRKCGEADFRIKML
eukprot:63463-Pelagomonas_calceolata.AAC.3